MKNCTKFVKKKIRQIKAFFFKVVDISRKCSQVTFKNFLYKIIISKINFFSFYQGYLPRVLLFLNTNHFCLYSIPFIVRTKNRI